MPRLRFGRLDQRGPAHDVVGAALAYLATTTCGAEKQNVIHLVIYGQRRSPQHQGDLARRKEAKLLWFKAHQCPGQRHFAGTPMDVTQTRSSKTMNDMNRCTY